MNLFSFDKQNQKISVRSSGLIVFFIPLFSRLVVFSEKQDRVSAVNNHMYLEIQQKI